MHKISLWNLDFFQIWFCHASFCKILYRILNSHSRRHNHEKIKVCRLTFLPWVSADATSIFVEGVGHATRNAFRRGTMKGVRTRLTRYAIAGSRSFARQTRIVAFLALFLYNNRVRVWIGNGKSSKWVCVGKTMRPLIISNISITL